MHTVEFFRCESCGNIVALIYKGGGTLVCCGHPMTKLVAKTEDAGKEKHVPVITKEGTKIKAVVGAIAHPMLPEHYIEWIALASGDKVETHYLKPGEKPEAEFPLVEHGTVYEYCSVHGLWKAEF
jgi:superoxide reductase